MKSLKYLFLTATIILSLITLSCAGKGTNTYWSTDTPPDHKVEIVVTAPDTDNLKIMANEALVEYEPVDSPYLELSQLTSINAAGDTAFMKLFSGLSVSDVTRLWGDIMYLHYETDIVDVKLYINSPGGDAFSGLALADLIVRAQNQYGLEFAANASGIIASAAVPVFAVCDFRIAAPGTIFMVHEAALWKWPGRETASDIRSQNALMILLQDRYLGYLVRNTKLSLEEWQAMEKATTWFNAERAVKVGLADLIK